MQAEIQKIKSELLKKLKDIKDSEALSKLEHRYLGRKGELTKLLRQVSKLNEGQKKEIGRLANETKEELKEKIRHLQAVMGGSQENIIDITLPGRKIKTGHLHPVTRIAYELDEVFSSMGFMVLEGPELESDYYNFEALNIPAFHPARDMQDTFYVRSPQDNNEAGTAAAEKSDLVMRTHTSPMQVRAMQEYGAPLRCVVPGRVFRAEATDAAHEHTFDQMEGLMIDKDISVTNLIAVMKELIYGIFNKEVETRVRPGYFPFVEPGIELDIKCTICGGRGCPSCKHLGWLELLPAGMVHPNVLKYGGIDPDLYSGFAFGLGLTRLAMMKYEINDIRLFNSGDLRFLEQF